MSRKRDRRERKLNGQNLHHLTPRSRGGGSRSNTVTLPMAFHAALHTLASNLTKAETLILLDIVLTPDTEWSGKDLHNLRERIKQGGY